MIDKRMPSAADAIAGLADGATIMLSGFQASVHRLYTDLAVVDVATSGFVVREMLDGLCRDELQARTRAPLPIAPDCTILRAPDL